MVQIVEQVLRAQPYQAGKPIGELAREIGMPEADIVKLASNENPLGMSPVAREQANAALLDAAFYPDANGFELKAALAQRFAVPHDWLTLGNGSNDILELLASTFLAPGTSAVFSQYAFIVYAQATLRVGAQSIVVPASEYGHDLDAMLAAIRDDTSMVFIANPNNPTGTYLSAAQIEAFISQVPSNVVVVLDEAYNEYLPPELRVDSIAWVRQYPNVVITRTFSKAYGLAGLRVGYAIASAETTEYMNRIRQPFNVSNVAQAAAIGALQDDAFRQKTYETNLQGLAQLSAGLDALGIEYVRSHGNFVLAKFGAQAAQVNAFLLKHGIIVRPVGGYGLPEWLRISVGLEEQNARLLNALKASALTG
ncbi:histidinol-phosphate transaminase [Burkholderia sp. L27(2015)]|uniref:histidinol-phosphate transaminase n=1 Tax=Burkholderia sp. L27(2015) TaxID=1641858 RepID=UPI00131E1C20|nr:histidinol-phosphate transaminase [Burkholderia sp. L27(2015)]